MSELTPLEQVPGIDPAIRTKLAGYWITSAEELVSTARSSNAQYGSGLKALAVALDLDDAAALALIQSAQTVLPSTVSFAVGAEMDVGAGAIFDDLPAVDATSFGPPAELPAVVEPLAELPEPQNQGKRNSCVAFSLAAIMQILTEDPTDLSEQFIYWACKDRDGYPGDVGTSPLVGMQVLEELGVCREDTWPYDPISKQDNPGHAPASPQALAEAKQRRLKGFRQLPPTDVRQIQAALAQGHPVLIGLKIWEHWTEAWQARSRGRLRQPLPGERPGGGHAMCVLGYREDDSAPGKGYFIVRNSWGADWGSENPDGPGYCHVPFALVFAAGLAAFAAEDAVIMPREATSMSPDVAIEPAQPTNASATLAAILAEARSIRTRIDDLIGQLEAIASGNTSTATATTTITGSSQPATTTSGQTEQFGSFSGPLIFIRGDGQAPTDELAPNGIDGTTGQPLLRIDAAAAGELARAAPDPKDLNNLHKSKQDSRSASFGVVAGIAQESLGEARWAVVVNALEDAGLLKAVWPLIDHRMRQMQFSKRDFDFRDGENCVQWLNRHTDNGKKNLKDHWGQIPPVLIFRPDGKDQRVGTWLARHGVSQGPVDPRRGVPFYLMLLGRPGPIQPDDQIYIPLNFQYELDIFWGVGRLCFTGTDGRHRLTDYTTYANRVIDVESRSDAEAEQRLNKQLVLFGTRHELDTSTIRSADELVTPLNAWSTAADNIPARQGIVPQPLLGADATRANLARALSGGDNRKPPAVFFSATHGIGLPPNDDRLVLQQGALVTQDWTGFGSIKREHWFGGEEISAMAADLRLDGNMAFLFACYGAGCPQQDEFIFDPEKGRPQIAPFPFVAQLPQQLLLHGTLAVLGHVERAWTYSFSGTETAIAQSQPFEDVIGRLLLGYRAGSATDDFNVIQGARAMSLTQELEDMKFGKIVEPLELARLWMARNDARNYALLGDPAVRLPFQEV
jgi:hypothetical protein